jgi:hypothetical protein
MNDEKGMTINDDAAKVVESLVLRGDLSGLNPAQRARHYVRVCESLGLNPDAQPFAYLRLNGKEILYATRGATDQLAAIHRITREIIDGPKVMDLAGTKVVMCAAKATHPNGRTETSIATLPFADPTNVLMKAETKAKRRVTMSILGLALLDEMELETIPAAVQEPGGGVDLAAIGIERNIGTAKTLPAPARWADELAECVTLTDVRGLYATHSRYAYEDAPARNRAMVDDVRAWLSERGVPGVTGAEVTAILSTLPEGALRALSELWCDEEHPVSDRCVTAARAIHRAEWDEHSRRTAHAIVVRCYAHATGYTALNAAGADLCALRDTDVTPADDVPADVLAKIAAKGSVREILNSVGAHAAEVLASPALAKAYASRLVTFAAADDPRDDAQRMADATAKVRAKANAKVTP